MPTRKGAFRLFQIAGITVFLHWSWFVVAVYEVASRGRTYSTPVWNVAEYVALFAIVTMHEFGHALACRSVGGRADEIVLWPLGGVAYVRPPQRPGAWLWSIAAGPLVNLALFPVLGVLWWTGRGDGGWHASMPDTFEFVRALFLINAVLLVFNLLPVYPLDGGQILRSLLWFVAGRGRSLTIATLIGLVGSAGLLVTAVAIGDTWFGVIAVFMLLGAWAGFARARALEKTEDAPRREGFACPLCKAVPPVGAFWACGKCRAPFDTFETLAACPKCLERFATTMCTECNETSAFVAWAPAAPTVAAESPSPT